MASSFTRAMTTNEIEASWEDLRQDASSRGTEAHYQMELYLNRDGARISDPEVRVGMRFLATEMVPLGAKAWRTELEFGTAAVAHLYPDGLHEDLAGSIDAVFSLPDSGGGGFVVVDWKRSPKLRSATRGIGRNPTKMEFPLDHLDACDVAKYALQLSIYAYALRRYGLDARPHAGVSASGLSVLDRRPGPST